MTRPAEDCTTNDPEHRSGAVLRGHSANPPRELFLALTEGRLGLGGRLAVSPQLRRGPLYIPERHGPMATNPQFSKYLLIEVYSLADRIACALERYCLGT